MKKSGFFNLTLFLTLILLVSASLFFNVVSLVGSASMKTHLSYSSEGNSVRITLNDIELYFNATNGGEITEYYDLTMDPLRLRNLSNLSAVQHPLQRFCSLSASAFYDPKTYTTIGTGLESNATVKVITNRTDYIILQTFSRLIDLSGNVASDVENNPLYINSTWVFFGDGRIFLERALHVKAFIKLPLGWRWYPFYTTRTMGFNNTPTFYMFNSTYSYTTNKFNQTSYTGIYSTMPTFPRDQNHVFGIGVPFANKQLGGDGGHNLVIVYNYEELNVSEWKSDNINSKLWQTGFGPVHQLSSNTSMFPHKYQMLLYLTHQSIGQINVMEYAKYFARVKSQVFPPYKVTLSTNKSIYNFGDRLVLNVTGIPLYEMHNLTARLISSYNQNNVVYSRLYGPFNAISFSNYTLLERVIKSSTTVGNYTFALKVYSQLGILIGQSSIQISVVG